MRRTSRSHSEPPKHATQSQAAIRAVAPTRWRRLAQGLQTAWSIVGIAGLLFVVVNILAWQANRIRLAGSNTLPPLPQAGHAPNEEVQMAFAAGITRFHQAQDLTWQPYTYWRGVPRHDEFTTIDAHGLRKTHVAPEVKNAPALYVFGGSAAWGSGARDDHTIPSELAKALGSGKAPMRVVNRAQQGYVSTQDTIALEQCLTAGEHPRIAVFYSGFNDVASLVQSGRPGLSINEDNRRAEFNILQRGASAELLSTFVRGLPLFEWFAPADPLAAGRDRAIRYWGEFFTRASTDAKMSTRLQESLAREPLVPSESEADRQTRLILEAPCREVVRTYARQIASARALAEAFGVRVIAFWQPTVFLRANPSEHEKKVIREESLVRNIHVLATDYVRRWATLVPQSEGSPEQRALAEVIDLSGTFDNEAWRGRTAFYDACHTTEEANRAIAGVIAQRLLAENQ